VKHLQPRTIMVTGGASGLGEALVRRLSEDGHQVAAADCDETACHRLAGETGCLAITADVSVPGDNERAVRTVVGLFGGLVAVCLNAGIPGGTSIGERFDPGQYRRSMSVNLDGVVYGVNAALPHLRSSTRAAILITASVAGIAPSPDLYYAAAKHALIGLTRSLALLLQPEHITVNAICPGFIDTPILAGVRQDLTDHGFALASPAEVAAAAAPILASPESGNAWEIQANQQPFRIHFPEVTLRRNRPANPEAT
jgi:NAD(P)-dependent dehydrogenase (short-subunit alcohol dehydrogenase family)